VAALKDVSWAICDVCAEEGRIGIQLPSGRKCWAHADDKDLDDALKRLGEDGRLDARGVPIATPLLLRLRNAAPHDDKGNVVLTDVLFVGTTFQGDVGFERTIVQGVAWFVDATFQRDVAFGQAMFLETSPLRGGPLFTGATFQGDAWFQQTTFRGNVLFDGATFQGDARFQRTTFRGDVLFDRATFQGDASFTSATFLGRTSFRRATFQRESQFRAAFFQHDAGFQEASFQRSQQLGPMLVRKSLMLDQAVFQERTQIEVDANAVCCQRTQFLKGVQLRVRWAQVVLDDADLAAPSILMGGASSSRLDKTRWARAWKRLRVDPVQGRPRLVSLRRADVTGLTIANVDLRACRFLGAHHLDELRVQESNVAYSPRGWRWTTRQTIAEEHHWRVHRHRGPARVPNDHSMGSVAGRSGSLGHSVGWYPSANQPPAWLEVELPTPTQIAGLYRALRKGREDSKNEPGAADYYYGEMEMRRQATRRFSVERAILTLYWFFSGYGLRAWRAVAGWVLLVLVGTAMFAGFGFKPPTSPQIVPVGVSSLGQAIYKRQGVSRSSTLQQVPDALAFSVESTVSLLRPPDRSLTLPGRWTQMLLRILGPVLFGLMLLSLRGRVKR
jgi:uncharacterized protein YjbI with pentapeptide repeats